MGFPGCGGGNSFLSLAYISFMLVRVFAVDGYLISMDVLDKICKATNEAVNDAMTTVTFLSMSARL